ncbi:unnamed protein product, partial [Meganyctiphanes norvegica]
MGITSRIRDQLYGKKVPPQFEWLGEEVEATGKQRRQVERTFYRWPHTGRTSFYQGVRTLLNYALMFFNVYKYIKCLPIYKNTDSNEPRCEVRWYSRVTAIASSTFRNLAPGCPPVDKELEVVFEERNFVTDVDVESIFCMCTVEEVTPETVPSTVPRRKNVKGPFYVCRFSYRSKKPQLQPLNLDGVNSIEKNETHQRLAARRSLVIDLSNVGSSVKVSKTPSKSSRDKENNPKTPKSAKKSRDRSVSPEIPFQGDIVKYELLRNVNSPARSSRTPTKSLVKSEAKTPKSAKKSGNKNVSPEIPFRENRYRVMTPSELDLPSSVKLKLRRLEDESPTTFGDIQLPISLKRKAIAEADNISSKKQRIALEDISQTQSPFRRRTNVVNYQQLNRGEVDRDGNKTPVTPKSKSKYKSNNFSGFNSPVKSNNSNTKSLATPTKASTAAIKNSESPFKSPLKNEKGSSPSQSPLMSPKELKDKIKQIGKVRALKKDEISDLLGSSSDEDKTPQKKAKLPPKSKSTAKKRFVCDECGDKFSTRTELQDHEEEHEDFKPITKTPGRRKAVKSKKTESKTPRKTSQRSLATPGMPEREGPVAFPQTPLEKARSVLHVSAVPRELPCREEEYAEIFGFVEGKLQDGTGGCLYISGVPGTGKTATVREVVRYLKELVSEGDLPQFDYQEINAMRLTEPHQLWVQVWKHLTGQKVTAAHAASLLEKRFSTPAPRREPTLLLVDELDMLWTRKQDVMYNLFDWPSRPGSKLIIVAIANTMDLPERVMINRVASRLGLTRMNFQPYNHEQLQTIVESRLMGIDAFDTNAVRLVARKTAAASGDARRALDICRRATEIAERKAVTGTSKSPRSSPRKSPTKGHKTQAIVELMDVDQAIKEMFSSPMIMAIRSCSLMEQYLLKAVIAEFMRTGLEEAVLSRVIDQFGSIVRFEGYQPACVSEIMLMLNRLAQQTLILTEHSRQDLAMRVRLNISMDDVNYALQQNVA